MEAYGRFHLKGANVVLDPAQVPSSLHALLPYAAFWGMADDWARENLVQLAPATVLKNLKGVVARFDDLLDEWLAGSQASDPSPTREYIAFSAMRLAADFA